jgi:SNF2 family DNA or RNA helicase
MRRSEVAREIPLKTYEEYDVSIPARLNIGYNEIQIEGEDEIVLSRVKMQLSTWRREVELEKAKASMDYLKQMIESTPLVIFALHTETVDLISSSLGIPSIQGDTSSNERQRIVDDFQQGKTSGVVGTFGAMSVGLTLTHSHHVIMISREWTPAINAQAEDRCCRMGQNRGVIVIDIVSNSKVDQLITSVLKRKQRLIDSIVEAT